MVFPKRRILQLRKRWLALGLVLWTIFSLFIIWNYSAFNLLQPTERIPKEIQQEITTILDANYPKFKTEVNEIQSSVYQWIFKGSDNLEREVFHIMKNYNLQERCELYFSSVNTKNGIIVDPNYDFKFDKFDYLKWEEYYRDSVQRLKDDPEEDFDSLSEDDIETKIKVNFENAKAKMEANEQILRDYFLHVKIFHKCYVDKNDDFIQRQKQMLSGINVNNKLPYFKSRLKISGFKNLESKVFPWLTQKSPLYEDLTTGQTIKQPVESNNFLFNFKNLLSGKGIVMTISDSHLDDCIRLIHLLRYLKNPLPIQIIHTGLSDSTKFQLHQAGTSDFKGFIQQSITFVDVVPAISQQYLEKFNGFGNKILAILFNTFEEMIFLDADTILTQNPMKFFKLKKYKKSGALFFKDRNTAEFRPDHDIKMFLKLMNTNMDTKLFDLPQISKKTMDIPLFSKKRSHMMESGLVLINRKLHFSQSLIMANMYFFHPITDRIYGDKEMFWLALSISGDENFEFNKHPAAAIGQITPLHERIKGLDSPPKSFISKEICSNHPAHISDEDNHSLLWFNSGFKFCSQLDKVNFEEEFDKQDRFTNLQTLDQFKTFWESKLLIESAIVPPENSVCNEEYNSEPLHAWKHMQQYCHGYTWCAYSSIGNGKDRENKGFVIKYSHREKAYFRKLGEIWMSDYNYSPNE